MRSLALPCLVFVGVAVLLTLPAMIAPQMTHDSFWLDWVWAEQFTAQLRSGVLYPRWLPESHNGLGSPVFYFYPPLAFYVTALFGLVLPTYASILAAFCAGFALSGFAMYLWLRGTSQPLLGAIFYMVAPYHVFDFYRRGALAEFIAIALIPFIALGIRKAFRGEGWVLLAVSYAALLMTHLPMALLVSLFLVVPYALVLTRQPSGLIRIGLPLTLGLGLAAVYLVPAVALNDYRDSDVMWAGVLLKPANWFVLNPHPGINPERILDVGAMVAFLGFVATMLVTRSRWALYAIACCLLAAGFIPPLWELPLLEKVQFPYRVLPLAEFAIATAIATRIDFLVTAGSSLLVTAAVVGGTNPKVGFAPEPAMLENYHPDVAENLPPSDRAPEYASGWALEMAERHPEATFVFPAWETPCTPTPEGLIEAECPRRLVLTMAEKAGAGLSVLVLLFLAYRITRQSRRKIGPEHGDG